MQEKLENNVFLSEPVKVRKYCWQDINGLQKWQLTDVSYLISMYNSGRKFFSMHVFIFSSCALDHEILFIQY